MIIGLVLATVFASALSERTGLPWSALLTIVVAPVLFIPGIETVSLDTQLILPIFIPPLLWSLARRTSWAMIRAQVHVVLVMSVVLVFLTIAALTATAMWLMPGIGLAAAMVLAAALAVGAFRLSTLRPPPISQTPTKLFSKCQADGFQNANQTAFKMPSGSLAKRQPGSASCYDLDPWLACIYRVSRTANWRGHSVDRAGC